MDRQTREIIEDVGNLVALQVVRPLENRLTALETRCNFSASVKKSQSSNKWKIAGFTVAALGWLTGVLSFVRLMVT